MCRINGIVDKRNEFQVQDIIAMRDIMHRGGPDHSVIYNEEN